MFFFISSTGSGLFAIISVVKINLTNLKKKLTAEHSVSIHQRLSVRNAVFPISFWSWFWLKGLMFVKAACEGSGGTLASSASVGLSEFLKSDKVLKRKKFVILSTPNDGNNYVFAAQLDKISRPKKRAPAVCERTATENEEMMMNAFLYGVCFSQYF